MQHLYIHVPFCVRRCSYCCFWIAVRKRIPAAEYVDSVLREWGSADPGPAARGGPISTLYLGGGTPSLLPPDAITTIVDKLLRSADPGSAARRGQEVTLEANPEDVTPDKAKAWRAAGINRVSLGAQSFHDALLKWMHRSHDAARICAPVLAREGAGTSDAVLRRHDAPLESAGLGGLSPGHHRGALGHRIGRKADGGAAGAGGHLPGTQDSGGFAPRRRLTSPPLAAASLRRPGVAS